MFITHTHITSDKYIHQLTHTHTLKNSEACTHLRIDTHSPNHIHSKTHKRNSQILTDSQTYTHKLGHTLINSCLASLKSCIFDRRISGLRFKVCKPMLHRTIQINHQPDATIFQFIILAFIYSSTCFGRFLAHHQELNDCSGSLWFYLRIVVTAVLCSWSGPTTNTAQLSPRYEGKTRGCYCSH